MAILGVLLGITMTVLVGGGWWAFREYKAISADLLSKGERLNVLERRKAVLTEAVAAQPKPAGVGAVHSATRIRTWDQDAPYVEKASH